MQTQDPRRDKRARSEDSDSPTPETPRSGKKRALTGAFDIPATRTPTTLGDAAEVAASVESPSKMGGKAPSKTPGIPRNLAECSEEDQWLIMKRDGGSNWADIKREWTKATGQAVGNSTLTNRYARLKNGFTVVKEEDNARMIQAKQEIETSFNQEKWGLIAKAVQAKGGDKYRGDALQRHYRKIMLKAGAVVPAGIRDEDMEADAE